MEKIYVQKLQLPIKSEAFKTIKQYDLQIKNLLQNKKQR